LTTFVELAQAFWHGMALHLWQTTLALSMAFALVGLLRSTPAGLHSRLWTAGLLKLFLPLPLLAPLTRWVVGQLDRAEVIVEVDAVRTAWQTIWFMAEPWPQGPSMAAPSLPATREVRY
jgi:hypothetical protein